MASGLCDSEELILEMPDVFGFDEHDLEFVKLARYAWWLNEARDVGMGRGRKIIVADEDQVSEILQRIEGFQVGTSQAEVIDDSAVELDKGSHS